MRASLQTARLLRGSRATRRASARASHGETDRQETGLVAYKRKTQSSTAPRLHCGSGRCRGSSVRWYKAWSRPWALHGRQRQRCTQPAAIESHNSVIRILARPGPGCANVRQGRQHAPQSAARAVCRTTARRRRQAHHVRLAWHQLGVACAVALQLVRHACQFPLRVSTTHL